MRKILLALCLLGAMVLLGCSSSESCADFMTCAKTGEKVQACCTSTQCKYTVGSKTFNCNGTDCNAAAVDLTNYCT